MVSKTVSKSTKLQVSKDSFFQPIKAAKLGENIDLAPGDAVNVDPTPIWGSKEDQKDQVYYKVDKKSSILNLPSVDVYIKGSDLTPTLVSKTVSNSTKLQVKKDDLFQPIKQAGFGENIDLNPKDVVDVDPTPIKGKDQKGATADNVYYKVVKNSLKSHTLPSVEVYIKGRDLTP